jgi:hypothetical protein
MHIAFKWIYLNEEVHASFQSVTAIIGSAFDARRSRKCTLTARPKAGIMVAIPAFGLQSAMKYSVRVTR